MLPWLHIVFSSFHATLAEAMWPVKPNYLPIGYWKKEVCQPQIQTISLLALRLHLKKDPEWVRIWFGESHFNRDTDKMDHIQDDQEWARTHIPWGEGVER